MVVMILIFRERPNQNYINVFLRLPIKSAKKRIFQIYCLFSYQIFDDWFAISDPRVTIVCSEILMDFDLDLLLNFLCIDVIGNRIQ